MSELRVGALIGVLLLLAGCGGKANSDPDTASVAGTVYLGGAPAADVEVHFLNGGFSAFGITDHQGRYELVSGAAVGENTIYFAASTAAPFEMDPAGGMDEGQLLAMRDPGMRRSNAPQSLIPGDFSDPIKSKVRFVVPAGGARGVDFKLPR